VKTKRRKDYWAIERLYEVTQYRALARSRKPRVEGQSGLHVSKVWIQVGATETAGKALRLMATMDGELRVVRREDGYEEDIDDASVVSSVKTAKRARCKTEVAQELEAAE
jgi:hypothetical protein